MPIKFIFVVSLSVLFACSVSSQQLIDLTDQEKISLAIDYLRKGIQQEDTIKILKACGQEIIDSENKILSAAELTATFGKLFNSSSERKSKEKKPSFGKASSRLANSAFWDFDILDPEIKISGDTATVECKLVLWGARGNDGKAGKQVQDKLVFVLSIPEIRHPAKSEEYMINPKLKDGGKQLGFRTWRLVKPGSIIEFLGAELNDNY